LLSFELTDDLLTGHADVDRQHRMLFALARTFAEAQAPDRELVIRSLRFLIGYVAFHFAAEEKAMEDSAYPRRDHHTRQHALLREQVEAIRQGALAGESRQKVAARLHVLLTDFYMQHIRTVDRAFAVFAAKTAIASKTAIAALPTSEALVRAGRLDPEHDGIENRWDPRPDLSGGVDL
jgi:hemerythrin-like metal-binding protein